MYSKITHFIENQENHDRDIIRIGDYDTSSLKDEANFL